MKSLFLLQKTYKKIEKRFFEYPPKQESKVCYKTRKKNIKKNHYFFYQNYALENLHIK